MTAFFYKAFSLFMALLTYIGVGVGYGDLSARPVKMNFNVEYGTSEEQVMDVYVPYSAYKNESNGAVLFIHGGSWTGGDKWECGGDAWRYARNGYITASMNYTLIADDNDANAITMLDEITMAIAKLKEVGEKKGLNITKLATSGYSAGAHLSALYAYSRADESPIEIVLTANRVAPSDFHDESWREGVGYSLASRLSGIEITESMIADGSAEEVINMVSPAYFVNENSVPTVAGFGGKDTTVPEGNAAAMKTALENSGIDYEYIIYPNSSHMLFEDFDQAKQYDQAFRTYLEKYFGY